MANKLIALDADGVLLDYNIAYGHAWARAFGSVPKLVEPRGYRARLRYGLPRLEGAPLALLEAQMGNEFWRAIPALPGAVQACHALSRAGFDLVCVSALPIKHAPARLENLQSLGFPIADVFATPQVGLERSPKSQRITALNPLAFVDDYIYYLQGVPASVHKALIVRDPVDSPNDTAELAHLADSRHLNLLDFAQWWLDGKRSCISSRG